MFEKTKINEKEAGVGPFKKVYAQNVYVNRLKRRYVPRYVPFHLPTIKVAKQ